MAAQRGGKRPGAGRKPGSKSRATMQAKATLSDLARAYTEEAIMTIVSVMRDGETDMARLAACEKLLDRGYGRAPQAMEVTGKDGGAIEVSDVSDAKRLAAVAMMLARAARSEGK